MGAVYEAKHEVVGRRFAVKFLHDELAVHQHVMQRFRREAQTAGALENENIVAVTDFGVADDGAAYLVMEYLEGRDLGLVIAQLGTLSVPHAINIVTQACRGVAVAHARGIVHRDLKPENLLICRRGDGGDLVKVLDFGIAKLRAAGDEQQATTRAGMPLGTPHYMPPEQARGEQSIDHRADIYALGVILYELLSGKKPHPGDTYHAILYHILTRPPERIEAFCAGLPAGLAAVIHRALSPEPQLRFHSVAELSAALAPYASRSIAPLCSARSPGFAESTTLGASDVLTRETPLSVPSRDTSVVLMDASRCIEHAQTQCVRFGYRKRPRGRGAVERRRSYWERRSAVSNKPLRLASK